jgi:long-chain fatty acid transport protein
VIAGGPASPYGGLHRYGGDGPQRYASVSLDGSRFVIDRRSRVRGHRPAAVGATVQNMVSQITSRVVVSACPGAMTCAPEDPSFDAAVELAQNDYVAPSGSLGMQYDAADALTLGLSVQAPTRVSGSGTLKLELPSSIVFDAATVSGDAGRIAFTLPATIRAGLEWRPDERWRIEAALDELWSMHDDLTLEPIDVTVENVAGGSLAMQPMVILARVRDVVLPSIGAEWHGPNVMFGAGYSYETAAAPASHVSVLTVDAAKHVVGVGGGYEAEGWQIGAAAGLVALSGVDVPLATGKVTQLAPFADEPSTAVVNAGLQEPVRRGRASVRTSLVNRRGDRACMGHLPLREVRGMTELSSAEGRVQATARSVAATCGAVRSRSTRARDRCARRGSAGRPRFVCISQRRGYRRTDQARSATSRALTWR